MERGCAWHNMRQTQKSMTWAQCMVELPEWAVSIVYHRRMVTFCPFSGRFVRTREHDQMRDSFLCRIINSRGHDLGASVVTHSQGSWRKMKSITIKVWVRNQSIIYIKKTLLIERYESTDFITPATRLSAIRRVHISCIVTTERLLLTEPAISKWIANRHSTNECICGIIRPCLTQDF